MYILGIDFGTKKLGVAILEDSSEITSPLPLVKNDQYLWQSLGKIVTDYRIQQVVIGLPSYEDTAKKVKKFAEELQQQFSLTVSYMNEDNTSIGIKKNLRTQKQQQNLDSYSAVAILEQWLSERK